VEPIILYLVLQGCSISTIPEKECPMEPISGFVYFDECTEAGDKLQDELNPILQKKGQFIRYGMCSTNPHLTFDYVRSHGKLDRDKVQAHKPPKWKKMKKLPPL
jgi:hypothetical protein